MRDAIEVKELIKRCNAGIIERKRMVRRRHDDATPAIQQMLHRLAWLATMLHVHQATRRGRRHGAMFESLEAQRAWFDSHASSRPYADLCAASGWPEGVAIREVLVAR
jgi:hypothetical protein